MEQEYPLLRDIHPELVDDLVAGLRKLGETELAETAPDLRFVERCGCGDDFCQSVRTVPHPLGESYGEGYRSVLVVPPDGCLLVLDVVGPRIMYVEVLFRAPMTDQRADES